MAGVLIDAVRRFAQSTSPLGFGLDHEAYLIDGDLVVRRANNDADVERDSRVLEAVAGISPFPVPRPSSVDPAQRTLSYERVDGVPLIEIPADQRAPHAARIGGELGRFVRALAAAEIDVAPREEVDLGELLAEARDNYAAVAAQVPTSHDRAIAAFLDAVPPPPPAALAFCHNDLGIEHVLVDPLTLAITGVIDWSDAAVTDPARDLGLILRDLGRAALDAAMGAENAELRSRALFHARCALLEDLAYGLETGRRIYADKSVAGLAWLFPSAL